MAEENQNPETAPAVEETSTAQAAPKNHQTASQANPEKFLEEKSVKRKV